MITRAEDLTKIEQCTPQLRWVPMSAIGSETKLQQAWQVTLLDASTTPFKRYVEWRDVPYEAFPQP